MSEATDVLKAASRTGTVLGITTLIFGILCCLAPLAVGGLVTVVVAIILLAAGIARTWFAFQAPSFGRGVLVFLWGGLSILGGAAMLARPLFGLATVTMVLLVYFLLDGFTTIASSFQVRPARGWGWMLFGGIMSLVLAVFIWRGFPLSGAWAIGVLIGVRLILAGWTMIMVGAVGEGAAKKIEHGGTA